MLQQRPEVVGWCIFTAYLLVGWVIARVARRILDSFRRRGQIPEQVTGLLQKSVSGVVWGLAIVQALRSVGVDVLGILGAAGVAGVAIGFAAQTSLSNLISGIFLISERSVRLGDYIRVGSHEGKVEAVNLLSVSLRQLDNSLVRIPCESMIKNPVVNITGETERRCDFDIGVSYGTDLRKARQAVIQAAGRVNGVCRAEETQVTFSGFGDSSLNLHVGAWCATRDYAEVRLALAQAIADTFVEQGIEIPFPTRSVLLTGNNN